MVNAKRFLLVLFLVLLSSYASANYRIKSSNDQLGVNESIKDVITAADKSNLAMLGSGSLKTNSGLATYNQYIRFNDPTIAIPSMRTIYGPDSKNVVSDYLYAAASDAATGAMFEYELEFPNGLLSKIDSSGNLPELENKEITILNKRYMFVKSPVSTSSSTVTLNLIYGAITSTLKENEEREFKINNEVHKVKLTTISSSPKKAVIAVDNANKPELQEGETAVINGMVIGVSKIVVSESDEGADFVDIFIGAEKLSLKDTNYGDTSFIKGASLNGKDLKKAYVKIEASSASSTEFKISKIKYRLAPDSKDSNDIYMAKGSLLRSQLKEPEALIGGAWDISYNGLVIPSSSHIIFTPSANKVYKLTFTNNDGSKYIFPFVSNEASFKLGDSTGDFIFIEGSSPTNYIIDQNDYFLVNNKNDHTGLSNVMRYSSIDTANGKITFDDLSSGSTSVSYSANESSGVVGQGTLVVGGHNYIFYIQNATNNPLVVDQNGDGSINSGEVNLVADGGAIFDLGSTNSPGGDFAVTMSTISSAFDESSSNESTTINIEQRTSEVGISSITGLSTYNNGQSLYKGMTLYGALVSYDNPDSGSESLDISYPSSQVFSNVEIVEAPAPTEGATCSDGLQNQGESAIDCGGPCSACDFCSNGLEDEQEDGVDCGGACSTACPVENKTEVPPVEVQSCDGCWNFKACVPVGTRTAAQYCHESKQMKDLKQANDPCYLDYQCVSNACNNGLCASTSLQGNITLFNALIILLVLLAILIIYRISP